MKSNPSIELKEALENLSTLAAAGAGPPLAALAQLRIYNKKIVFVHLGTFQKYIRIFLSFFWVKFFKVHYFCKDELHRTVIESHETVTKNASLIYLWEGGTSDQRRFAAYAKTTIALGGGICWAAHRYLTRYANAEELAHKQV